MEEKSIKNIFKERNAKLIGEYKISAVMLLIYNDGDEECLLFEKRALNMRRQPGDICLPGGKVEVEETFLKAAIRETCEELMLEETDIEYIGEMDYLITPYGSILYPFVSYVHKFPYNFNKDEVHEVIKIPIKYFLQNEPLKYDMKIGPTSFEGFPFKYINGGENYKFSDGILPQYFYEYESIVIWGFTARIVKAFIDIIKEKTIYNDKL